MPWQFTILLQNLLASFYALGSRNLAKEQKKAHFQILAVVFAMVYLVFLLFALSHMSSVSLTAAVQYAPKIVGVGLAFTAWTVLTFITFRYLDAAIGTLLSTLNLLALVLVATFSIHEGLTSVQAVGASLLILSLYIVFSARQNSIRNRNVMFGVGLSIVASVFYGFAISGEKYLLDHVGIATYSVVGVGAQFLPLCLLAVVYNRDEFKLFKQARFTKRVILLGAIRAGAGLLFIVSLVKSNNASLIGVLSGFKIVLTTLLEQPMLHDMKKLHFL
jgi:drug/metabolite transporter (DMT)-like permease